jgi:hypothetical protein
MYGNGWTWEVLAGLAGFGIVTLAIMIRAETERALGRHEAQRAARRARR